MFQIGTTPEERQASAEFPRKLLAHYNPQWTLAAYCSYFQLYDLITDCEKKNDTACSAFFALLKDSFVTVRNHLTQQEAIALASLQELRARELETMRRNPTETDERLRAAYSLFTKIGVYRRINAEAFRRLLEKMMCGPALRSLELQQKLRTADEIIFTSVIGQAHNFNIDRARDVVTSMYALVFGRTYEQALQFLKKSHSRDDPNVQQRVFPMTSSIHYAEGHRHRYTQGAFDMRLLCGSSSRQLGGDVAQLLHMNPVQANIGRFANGEVSITIDEPVRGDDLFIVSTVCSVPAKHMSMSSVVMELMLLIQTAKQSMVGRVVAVTPFLPYNWRTQDSALLADMMRSMGVDGVLTVDMNREQAAGFFGNVPVHSISMMPDFAQFINTLFLSHSIHETNNNNNNNEVSSSTSSSSPAAGGGAAASASSASPQATNTKATAMGARTTTSAADASAAIDADAASDGGIVVVAPDGDSLKRAKQFADDLSEISQRDIALATAVKSPGSVREAGMRQEGAAGVELIGSARGKLCIIVDTLINEATKISEVAKRLHADGARRIIAVATHGLFSNGAARRIVDSHIDLVVVSDSFGSNVFDQLRDPEMALRLRVLPMAPLLSEAVQRIHADTVVSTQLLD